MPRKGLLEFDYVTTVRPSKRMVPMTDQTFHHMMVSTRLQELMEMVQMEVASVDEAQAWHAVAWKPVVQTEDTRYGGQDKGHDDGESVDWDADSDDDEPVRVFVAGMRPCVHRPCHLTGVQSQGGAEEGKKEEEQPVSRADVVDHWDKLPDERPIYLSALARTPNPNPLPPLSGNAMDETFLAANKGRIGSDEYAELVESHHPEVYQKQPLKVHMTACDQCIDLAPTVLTNLVTFFAMGGQYLKCYQVEKLLRLIPPNIPNFRVDVLVLVFSKIVRAVVPVATSCADSAAPAPAWRHTRWTCGASNASSGRSASPSEWTP